ncbi:MAG: hypothetical protein AMJ41_04560 [candidate division Zixibacteria bacterium DG_27]|nr:MAG: hypothetical protein AMJ41_04560 [candidate division Zixibacteria bacterium DG_27]
METEHIAVTFADLNGSGVEDLIISAVTFARSVKYMINLGPPDDPLWFHDQTIFAGIDSLVYNPSFADYDQDGDLDMGALSALYWFDFHFYENTGSTSQPIWEEDTSYFPDMEAPDGRGPFDVYVLDMDSDGDCDILASQWLWDAGFSIYGYKNIGSLEDPEWERIEFYIPRRYLTTFPELAFADLDADGDEDLIMGFLEPNLDLYENIGSPQNMVFDERKPEIWGNIWVYRCESVEAFDYDRDGDDDLTSTGNIAFWPDFYDYVYFRSWENLGSNSNCQWSEAAWIPSAPRLTGHWRLTSGDLNGDNRVDLGFSHVTHTPTDTLLLAYLNLYEPGQPEWEYDTTIFRYFNDPESDSDPELADLDSDGDMDLFMYTQGQFRFYENVGGPSSPDWEERPSWLQGLDDVHHAGRFLDLNRDGRLDLTLIASRGLKAYMNTGSLGQPSWTFTPEVFEDLDSLTFSYFDFSDLDGDGDEDLLGGTEGFIFYYENGSVTSVDSSTEISFVIPRDSRVRLAIYNLLGEVIARPLDQRLHPGRHGLIWNAEGFASGLYFYRLSAGEHSATRKMTIVK